MTRKILPRAPKEELMQRHDFNYIREHMYDLPYTKEDLVKDILEIYNDNLDLTQLSAEGKNTVRVTNYFVNVTQSKATSIRAKMSPYHAIKDDEALCEILNRIENHPRFFSIRSTTEEQLRQQGYFEIAEADTTNMNEEQKLAVTKTREFIQEALNKADLQEVRRALAHMPSFHRVSQFPNHVAQRIYERYAPKFGGVILDSSAGWGNRMMAALCSKYHYKYLGTDPNSEMHPNYLAMAELICKTLYETNPLTCNKKFPDDFIDIRDQGSEFDIPEWHNWSGYTPEQKQEILNRTSSGPCEDRTYEAHGKIHPIPGTLRGCCDTGKDGLTTGLKLEPIWDTHNETVYNSGIGDLSFTSPPYFALECYTEESFKGNLSTGQSAGKGDNYKRWLKEFVYPTVTNHFNYLKPGGYYIYNLKDLPADKMYLYSDWMSICLDVGFKLIEQPEMILKARRQFGKKEDGSDKINFNGSTEKIGVLIKPLTPTEPAITGDNLDEMYHFKTGFNYRLINECRPDKFTSKLPVQIEGWLKNKFNVK